MKKFLALLCSLLMPFCFLFGCAGDASTADRYSEGYEDGYSNGYSDGKESKEETKTGLPYKNGIFEFEYIVESHSTLLAKVKFRFSIIETTTKTTKLMATFYYYDEKDEIEKLLYRKVDQVYFYQYNFNPFELYEQEFYIPKDTFTNGKTVSSAILELVEA
ncbi:MAG: hypothetical protein IJB97_05440 [Clostridia bacterium]|nr:hypothetical protein [Clostridia bacterium]